MNIESDKAAISLLYKEKFGLSPAGIAPLAAGGSSRRYYLLAGNDNIPDIVGTCGDDARENRAFIYLARHFRSKGLDVPEIICEDAGQSAYLQSYISGKSLLECLGGQDDYLLLEKAMRLLAGFHYIGSRDLDFSECYPEKSLDANTVNWDLNYFKYSFLKVIGQGFDEAALQKDFDRLRGLILIDSNSWNTFMYRDFQSRNIIVDSASGNLYGIDFQGGRKGPAAYDVASFLWQAKAGFSMETKLAAIECYCRAARELCNDFSESGFMTSLPYLVLFRQLQVLGAYGFRGLIERKPHFIESLPLGIANLKKLFSEEGPQLASEFPQLAKIAESLQIPGGCHTFPEDKLTVTVQSFSYRKGYPADYSGNGGGFVFDCRAVHNPGRYEQYKPLTGMDRPVIEFLEKDGEIFPFLASAYSLVDAAVEKYLKRGFSSLSVGFGCTGGRHRSVYSAHAMAEHLRARYPQVNVVEIHREQPHLKTDRQN